MPVNVLPLEIRLRVLACLVEGTSIRATSRLIGVHHNTTRRLALNVGEACERLHDTMIRNVHPALIECDEIWTFVQKKQARVREDDPSEFGDQYTFVAMDPRTKLAISYLVGKRDLATTTRFALDLRARVVGAPQLNTDGLASYLEAFELAFGARHHHGVAIKVYQNAGDGGPEHRYSPGRVIGVERIRRAGSPDEENISTSRVERGNLTMRMCMRRFTRLSNGFSKRVEGLHSAVSLHFAFYNLCRVHETIKVTPAMEAGITDHPWSLKELLEMAMTEPEPSNDESAAKSSQTTNEAPVLRLICGGRG